jgi:hypothetical protein
LLRVPLTTEKSSPGGTTPLGQTENNLRFICVNLRQIGFIRG